MSWIRLATTELDAEESEAPAPVVRRPTAKMRTNTPDLDVEIYRQKRARRHRRQRFVRCLRKIAGLCPSCGKPKPKVEPAPLVDPRKRTRKGPLTCDRCLDVDRKYKDAVLETEKTVRYVDEFGRPMKLLFEPTMLPVIGPRYDGSAIDWPACESLSACMLELVKACGPKESPGASCPGGCSKFAPSPPIEGR